MKHVFNSKLLLVTLACIFASTLFWNSAAYAVDKTIPVTIGMDSQLGTTTVGDAATARAHAAIGQLQDSPGAKFICSWSIGSTEYRTDPNGAWQTSPIAATISGTGTTSTVSTHFNVAAYYRIEIKLSITFEPRPRSEIRHGEATEIIYQTAVGVGKIQYYDPVNGYVDVTEPLYVLKGTTVTFKAISSPSGITFPIGQPHWSGTANPSANGETTTASFSDESSSLKGYYTVVAKAGEGTTVTANVIVYDIILKLTPEDDFPGRSYDDYGIGEKIILSVEAEIGGSPLQITNALVGGKNSLKMKTITAQTLSNGNSWGDLEWIIEKGDGTLEDGGMGDGTGYYTVGDSAGSFELSVRLISGPPAG